MNVCEPIKELTEDKVIDILKHKKSLNVSIHEKMYYIKKDMDKTEDIIEMASFRSSAITDMPSGKGEHRDLTDVLLKYYKFMDEKQKELVTLFTILMVNEQDIERVWMCFLMLDVPYYTYIKRLYVDGEKYETIEKESGYSHQVFEKYRKEAIRLIIFFYNSEKSMLELNALSQRKLLARDNANEAQKPVKQEWGQLTIEEILNG